MNTRQSLFISAVLCLATSSLACAQGRTKPASPILSAAATLDATEVRIVKAVEQSTSAAFGAALIRNKIAELMSTYLTTQGVTGRIVYYRMSGGYLEIFTR